MVAQLKHMRNAVFFVSLHVLVGCTGHIQDVTTPKEKETCINSDECDPGIERNNLCVQDTSTWKTPVRVRRLTKEQVNQVWMDWLSLPTPPLEDLPVDEKYQGFRNNADSLVVSELFADTLMSKAESLAATGVWKPLVSCSSSQSEEDCAKEFIRIQGKLAFRRPITQDEIDSLVEVFQIGRKGESFDAGMELVVTAMLQSPSLLYRSEIGIKDTEHPGQRRLTDLELASSLSFLIVGTSPDAELVQAAEQGTLSQGSVRKKQAERMLSDPRARKQVGQFFQQWLGIENSAGLQKDKGQFPDFDPEMPGWFLEETTRFVNEIYFGESSNFSELFLADYSYMDSNLAAFYGVSSSSTSWERTPLPAERRGLLGQASLLATYAHANSTSPVLRGKFVRQQLFCTDLPPPPKELIITMPPVSQQLTTRERYKQHTENEGCSTCHKLMDPIGFTFENFDALGTFRKQENKSPIDSSGELLGTEDADRSLAGLTSLAEALAQSQQVKTCFAKQFFRYVRGMKEQPQEQCELVRQGQRLAETGGNMRAMLLHWIESEQFAIRVEGDEP
jgi:hypothetical protein